MIQERIDEINAGIKIRNNQITELEEKIAEITKTQDTINKQITEKTAEGAKAVNIKATGNFGKEKEKYQKKIDEIKAEIRKLDIDADVVLLTCLKRGAIMCESNNEILIKQFKDPSLNDKYGNYLGFFGEKMREIEEKWKDVPTQEGEFFRKKIKGIKEKFIEVIYGKFSKEFKKEAKNNKAVADNIFNKEAIEVISKFYKDELNGQLTL